MISNNEKKVRPQDKWDAKAGMVAKTYKVNKEIATEFQQVCKGQGVAMGIQLGKLMQQYIEEVKNQ